MRIVNNCRTRKYRIKYPKSFKIMHKNCKNVREPGVEPGSIAWKATMLPLYHSRQCFVVLYVLVILNSFTVCISHKKLTINLVCLLGFYEIDSPLKLFYKFFYQTAIVNLSK